MVNESEMKRVNIRVSPEVYDWFKMRSEKTGVSMSSLMFLALETQVQQQLMMPHLPFLLDEAKREHEERQKEEK